jgi:hypothetical protein
VADTLNSWVVGRAHTPRGLNYYTWAPNKFAASASFLALQAADLGINVQPYRRFAKSQVRLIVAKGPAQAQEERDGAHGEGEGRGRPTDLGWVYCCGDRSTT